MSTSNFEFIYKVSTFKNTETKFNDFVSLYYSCKLNPDRDVCSYRNLTIKMDEISAGLSSTGDARNIIQSVKPLKK